MTPRVLAKKIAKVAADHKATGVIVLDLRKLTSFTDFFVICSGNSDRQVQAIADAVRHDLKKGGKIPISEEGMRTCHWVLLDYGDVVVHVFYQTAREQYNLERLWYDAPRISFKGITAAH